MKSGDCYDMTVPFIRPFRQLMGCLRYPLAIILQLGCLRLLLLPLKGKSGQILQKFIEIQANIGDRLGIFFGIHCVDELI